MGKHSIQVGLTHEIRNGVSVADGRVYTMGSRRGFHLKKNRMEDGLESKERFGSRTVYCHDSMPRRAKRFGLTPTQLL